MENRNKLTYELDRQKSLKSLIEEKYKTINNDLIKQTIAGHQKRLDYLNNSAEAYKSDLDKINQNIINMEESKKEIENEIIALEKNLKSHRQRTKVSEDRFDHLRQNLAKIQGRLDLLKLFFPKNENKNDENTFYLITISPDGIVKRGRPADFANPDSFREEESKVLKEISKIKSNIKNRQEEESKLNLRLNELSADLSALKDRLNDNLINRNRISESLKSIEIESPKEFESLRAARQRLLEDEKKAEEYSKEIISIDGKIKGIENEADLKDKEIQELSEEKRRIQTELSDLTKEKSELTEKLLQIKLQNNFPAVEVDELTAESTWLKEREQYYVELSARIQVIKDFSDSGIEQIKQIQKKAGAEEEFKRNDILITGQKILEFERNCAKLKEDHYKLDIKQSEFKIKTEIITKNIIEDLETPLETAIASRGEEDDIEYLEMKKNQLRSRLGKIGPVNLIAAEELSELTQRNNFFENQLSDLAESKRSLIELVLELDQLIIERFKGIYDAISQNFSELSDLFFPGGKGKLILTDENNLLDSGIDIVINPKGKNVRSLNLLSGGERSMSALAFIFSLFLSRITPFCIMDEVDAALDDFNLAKFVDILRKISEKSQLLAITHQKKTMETADIIYGVSIDADGSSSVISQKAEVFADA
jgi:chromosome segregation protein